MLFAFKTSAKRRTLPISEAAGIAVGVLILHTTTASNNAFFLSLSPCRKGVEFDQCTCNSIATLVFLFLFTRWRRVLFPATAALWQRLPPPAKQQQHEQCDRLVVAVVVGHVPIGGKYY